MRPVLVHIPARLPLTIDPRDCGQLMLYYEMVEMPDRASRISEIDEVEMAGRVLNGEGVCVEGIRPVSDQAQSVAE